MIKVDKDFLKELRGRFCTMLVYVEDELLDRFDENNIIYKEVEDANKLLEKLFDLIEKESEENV